jgi:D-psicose/D-tagatose/L-ribulose 3-epimerase
LIALEPMSHFRTHVVNTPAQLMRLITLADHPNLRALLDTYHLVTEIRDYARAIRTVRNRLLGIHACENDRGVPGGGLIPWKQVFTALREIEFQGYLLLETYNSSLDDFAYRRGMFHNVCPDAQAFVRQGLTFLRQQAAAVNLA